MIGRFRIRTIVHAKLVRIQKSTSLLRLVPAVVSS